jgi:hypothetical protein
VAVLTNEHLLVKRFVLHIINKYIIEAISEGLQRCADRCVFIDLLLKVALTEVDLAALNAALNRL